MSKKSTSHRTYALLSLGCPKNLVDSEKMAGVLEADGYRMVTEPDGADLVVVNTCGFIGDARDESYAAIEEMLDLKRRGRVRKVIVAGCLAQRDRETLFDRFPAIDQLIGVFDREQIADAADAILKDTAAEKKPRLPLFSAPPSPPPTDCGRRRITLPHLAYLKIAEGCNRLCSFCSIPQLRGPYASKPIAAVLAEAEELAADGVRELVVIAQDTSFYGVDLDGRPQLAALVRRLESLKSLRWIRLMYLYPGHITDELIETIASSEKVVPYLDMPLQHINDDVLMRMRRRVNRDETLRLLERLRERIPGLALRTTLMTGFPGETDAQFEELLDFVREQRFERLGAFAFSNEPGTPAASLDGHLPEEVKRARLDRLMITQQEIAFARNASQVGRQFDVLIDRCVSSEETAYVGRTYADAPEVDEQIFVTGKNLAPGQIVSTEVVASQGYDLIGVKI